ncbi:hypothetical protein JCM11251_002923 [Rhodosporidiobolus azoricus]
MPKSLSALKQAQHAKSMAEWARRWLGDKDITSDATSAPSLASPVPSTTSITTPDHDNPTPSATPLSSAISNPFSPSSSLFLPATPASATRSAPFFATHPSPPSSTSSTSPSPPPAPPVAAADARRQPHGGKGFRAVDCCLPGPSFVRHIHSLHRQSAVMLSRLRLDFCDLGGPKRMLAETDPLRFCECGDGVETRTHYLLECRRYEAERRELAVAVRKAGGGSLSLSTLFSPRFTPFLLCFLHSSHCFPSLYEPLDTPSRPALS